MCNSYSSCLVNMLTILATLQTTEKLAWNPSEFKMFLFFACWRAGFGPNGFRLKIYQDRIKHKKSQKKKQGLLLFLLLHFLLPLSQVLNLTTARNKQSSTSWWSRVTFIHYFFSNCCSDKNVKNSSSNEIYDCIRCELNTFFLLSTRSGQYFTTLHFSNHNAP